MNVSIMQPYLFPYVGYFQLMASADVFVVHDDVQYIRGGWINRNRILSGGEPCWVTLPRWRQERTGSVSTGAAALRPGAEGPRRFLRRLEAGRLSRCAQLRQGIRAGESAPASRGSKCSPRSTCTHYKESPIGSGVRRTPLVVSSAMAKDDSLRGEARVIAICEALGAERYVNPIGGAALYQRAHFAEHGIELAFLRPEPRVYRQFGSVSVLGLSIIDVLMFNDGATVREMLEEFTLVEG